MTEHPHKLAANQLSSPDVEHETNYAVEVLQKEYPRIRPDKIKRALQRARSDLDASADRWQVLNRARTLLSDR